MYRLRLQIALDALGPVCEAPWFVQKLSGEAIDSKGALAD
jgi:hypothetical protein